MSAVGTIHGDADESSSSHSPVFILTVTQETSSYLLVKAREDDDGSGAKAPKLEMSIFKMPLFDWDEYVS